MRSPEACGNLVKAEIANKDLAITLMVEQDDK